VASWVGRKCWKPHASSGANINLLQVLTIGQ
jgi:hypothetical protein